MKKFLKRFRTASNIVLLLLVALLVVISFYVRKEFPQVTVDELYFYYNNGMTNSSKAVIFGTLYDCLVPTLLVFTIFITILYDITFGHLKLNVFTNLLFNKRISDKKKKIGKIKKSKNFSFQFYPIKLTNNHRYMSTFLVLVLSIYIILNNLNCIEFIRKTTEKSKFIETNYISPKNTTIEFNEKRNLIFIVVESLETTFFTKKQGGYWNYEVTPELYKLLSEDDSVVFYGNNKGEQMTMLDGITWTTAGIVANTTGLPFKVPIDGNEYHSKNFMNGAYALGDLLKDNGYYNELISSARTNFGGIQEYYTKHGSYKIIDINSLNKYNLSIKKSDKNSWGFSDKYLFDTAKERLNVLSQKDQPFNLQLITIDTHFPDGHKYSYTTKKYKTQYENVYSTTSKEIYDFINWVKEQDFYPNTTIVIVGDHISMQEEFFTSRGINASDRYIYNCYINPAVSPVNTENRIYSELDTYPSIIAAIGGEIEGNMLGLGVNLFSDQQTLTEQYGLKEINKEIMKKSIFYNNEILGSDYKNMLKQIGLDEDPDETMENEKD